MRPARGDDTARMPRDIGWTDTAVVAMHVGQRHAHLAGRLLWTNATDMSRALYALMSQGRVTGIPGCRPTVVATVSAPHTPMPNIFVGGHYGYGLMIARDRGDALLRARRDDARLLVASCASCPERRFGIAILANLDNAPLRRIAQVGHGEGVVAARSSKPPARQETPVTPTR